MHKYPGFYDSHLHFLGLGYIRTIIMLHQYKSIEDVIKIKSDKDFIHGIGWHENQFEEKRYLNKDDLNQISLEKPVIFTRVCGHVLVCNDKAMEMAGVTEEKLSVPGGSFDFETGVFREDAMKIIKKILPKYTKEQIKEMFIMANDELLSNGITYVASDDFSTLDVPYEMIIEALEELYEEGKIQVRLYEQCNLPSKELIMDFISKGYHKKEFKGFKLGPLKLLADGSLGGRTAYMNEPYTDDRSTKGIKVFTDRELEDLIRLADKNGMDVAIHAIGDGIIDIILDKIQKTVFVNRTKNHRHSIIHAQLMNQRQTKRAKDLKVQCLVQPIFLNSDIPIIEERIGTKRANESYIFKSMYDQGIKVGFSTDAPVEGVNPFHNIYSAMTRKSIKNPDLEAFLPNERFSLEESLKCYTEHNYYHSYDENQTFDDYIVIDRDLSKSTPEEIRDAVVLETYIDGKLVYKK